MHDASHVVAGMKAMTALVVTGVLVLGAWLIVALAITKVFRP